MNSGFALLDGISIRFAQMHNSSYTSFMLWCDFFNAIAPFLASLTIRDSSTFGETGKPIANFTHSVFQGISYSQLQTTR